MGVKKINKFVLESTGKEFDTFEEATIEAMKEKIRTLANNELPYDYGKSAYNFIIENKKAIGSLLNTIKNMEEK